MPSSQLTRVRGRVAPPPPTHASSVPRVAGPPEDRLMRWVLLLFFAVLPLQWYRVPGLPLGPLRLHLLGIAAFILFVLVRYRGQAWRPVIRTAFPVLAAMVVFVLVWAGTSVYNQMTVRGSIQEAIQLVALAAVGTAIYRAAAYPTTRVLEAARWAALVAAVSVLVALSLSMAANGVNPAATFAQTIAQGNPEILQKELFKSAFAGYGFAPDAVQGNIRHEVFGAVLTAMCLSSAAARLRPFTTSRAAQVYRFSIGLGAVLLVVSLSRSDMLAGLLWVLLAFVTQARRLGVTGRQVGVVAAALVGVGVAVASGFASVVYNRFTQDTSSYQVRDTRFVDSIAAIPSHFWTGGIDTAGVSSHMFILDSTLRAGVLDGLAALVIVLLVVSQFVQLAVRLPVEPRFMLPVTATLALPIIRFFTAGGGVIPPVQYVGLGIFAGFLAYRRTLSGARRTQGTPHLQGTPQRTAVSRSLRR